MPILQGFFHWYPVDKLVDSVDNLLSEPVEKSMWTIVYVNLFSGLRSHFLPKSPCWQDWQSGEFYPQLRENLLKKTRNPLPFWERVFPFCQKILFALGRENFRDLHTVSQNFTHVSHFAPQGNGISLIALCDLGDLLLILQEALDVCQVKLLIQRIQ